MPYNDFEDVTYTDECQWYKQTKNQSTVRRYWPQVSTKTDSIGFLAPPENAVWHNILWATYLIKQMLYMSSLFDVQGEWLRPITALMWHEDFHTSHTHVSPQNIRETHKGTQYTPIESMILPGQASFIRILPIAFTSSVHLLRLALHLWQRVLPTLIDELIDWLANEWWWYRRWISWEWGWLS